MTGSGSRHRLLGVHNAEKRRETPLSKLGFCDRDGSSLSVPNKRPWPIYREPVMRDTRRDRLERVRALADLVVLGRDPAFTPWPRHPR
jgi:hypothetical protein